MRDSWKLGEFFRLGKNQAGRDPQGAEVHLRWEKIEKNKNNENKTMK